MLQENGILAPDQVADELSLNVETVRILMRQGVIPAAKVGGRWRTTRRALYGYLENQMGLESRVHPQRPKGNGERRISIQRRSTRLDKARERNAEKGEVFFAK